MCRCPLLRGLLEVEKSELNIGKKKAEKVEKKKGGGDENIGEISERNNSHSTNSPMNL